MALSRSGRRMSVHKLEAQHLGMLPDQPVVRLIARQPGAVDAALLARAHADGLAVLHIAHGVGLGVFQGDERHHQVDFRAFGQLLVLGDDVIQQSSLVDFQIVSPLLKGDADRLSLRSTGSGM